MATLFAPAQLSVHLHAARRVHFSASSDGRLLWLSEECWGRGLVLLGELLVGAAFSEGVELLIERQAEQPESPVDPELEAPAPFLISPVEASG